jgi:sorting nexin-25
MEFMDRRQRSLPVQFWLTVESFKNPLETVDSDSSGDEEEIIQDPSTLANVKEDIAMIHNLYFAGPNTHTVLTSIPKKHVDLICAFVLDPMPSTELQRRVRRSVLLAQKQVERGMEQDFEDFERSELWFRAIGDSAFTASKSFASPFEKEHEPLRDSSQIISHSGRGPLSPPTQLNPGFMSAKPTPQSELSGVFGIQRIVSSTSDRSTQSKSPSYVPSNIEVLMSSVSESSTSEPIRAPLFDDPEDEMQRREEKRMEAIHAALTDIISLDQQEDNPIVSVSLHERKPSVPLFRTARRPDQKKQQAVFDDVLSEDTVDPEENEGEGSPDEHGSFQPAAPGDLQLSYEIDRLSKNLVRLQEQHAMLETLIKKAELAGDTQELRLLRKSKNAMTRELRELQFQKQQYEQQESANRLISDRTKVSIVNSTVADEGGKQVMRYLVEVQQLASDRSHASGWVVARRYNEFHTMYNKLKERYALVKTLEFPGKRLVTSLSGSFLDSRKQALEKYLQVIISQHSILYSMNLSFDRRTSLPYLWYARVRSLGSSFHATPLS